MDVRRSTLANVNPSDTNDIVGEAVRGTRATGRCRRRRRQGGISGMVALDPAGPLRHSQEGLG